MEPVSPSTGAPEVVLAKDQPEYRPLPVGVYQDDAGRVTLVSRWQLTAEERAAVAAGEDLYVGITTFGRPMQPLQVQVGPGDWTVPPTGDAP